MNIWIYEKTASQLGWKTEIFLNKNERILSLFLSFSFIYV